MQLNKSEIRNKSCEVVQYPVTENAYDQEYYGQNYTLATKTVGH